ncbi:RNB domain-containing ribonuclease [Natronosporangium hydrolyticum]|uniref:RNB domain-containing ribonuclease n=1 Tax=Natronosporangium hydrolyticum TaxID=2811111 RepID=A0A895YAS0_9ACTN|nr:RNB domain-containing ribonuclease [Natronosporangium hydrolyticum]QSB13342.1 RNB domain-containing ribonuclease [Natronosporangium hydrolyticum]
MSNDEWPVGVMIDQPGSTDRDDAVWVVRAGDRWRVSVFVADVAKVVRLGSPADVAALRRIRTVYTGDRTIPMLPPEELAQATLRTGRPAPVCRFEITVTSTGEPVETVISRGVLTEPVATTYQEAAAALADPAHRLHSMLVDAYELAQVLLARRRAAGALAVYDLHRGWATDEDGRLVSLAAAQRNAGYLIVQELMIAANEAAARWAVAREVPLLFRNHRPGAASREEVSEQLSEVTTATPGAQLLPAAQQLASMLRPAVYEPWAGGHFGLNLPAYTHATSPLRRYPDLVTQRMLFAAVAGAPAPYQLDTVAEMAATLNLRFEAQRVRRSAYHRAAAQATTRAQLVTDDYRQLDDGTFGKVVKLAVTEGRFNPELGAELQRRADAGQLLPRDAAMMLFAGHEPRWRPVRDGLLRWLAREPAHAVTVLSLYGQREFGEEVRWQEESVGSPSWPRFQVRAQLGEHRSPARSASSKRAARQQAALALVAGLAELPDVSADVAAPAAPGPPARIIPPEHPPAMAINELAQLGELTAVCWSFTAAGAAHEPVHRCQVTAERPITGEQLVGAGEGATKAAAKAAAAADLWARLGSGELS